MPRVPRPHNHIPIRQEDGVVRVLVTIATKRRSLRAARPKQLRDFHHGDDGVRAKVHDPALAVLKGATFVSSRGRDHFSVWVEKQRKAKAGNHKQTLQTNSQPRVERTCMPLVSPSDAVIAKSPETSTLHGAARPPSPSGVSATKAPESSVNTRRWFARSVKTRRPRLAS